VKEQRDDARRRGAHEQILWRPARCTRLEIVDVHLHGVAVADADRAIAARHLAACPSTITVDLLMQARIRHEVRIRRRLALAAEPIQPILDVGGVARFRHFAVVDDVDAGGGLASNDVSNRITDSVCERMRLDGNPLFLREHHADQIFGTRQAARMSGQESIAAALHRRSKGIRYQVSGVRRD